MRLAYVRRQHLGETDKRDEALKRLMALRCGETGKSGAQERREVARNLGREIRQRQRTR